MKVTGSARPERIWVRYIEKGNAVVRLRDNISEVADDVVDGEMVNRRYEYDEVELTLADRERLTDYITKNFAALFEYGIEQMNKPKEKTKDERMEELEMEKEVTTQRITDLEDLIMFITGM